jgi:D-alanyl-D-alanine carboxypeptidase/D-alanyl-D-alanine-endopeptidase (penicillin-binding protein 4)
MIVTTRRIIYTTLFTVFLVSGIQKGYAGGIHKHKIKKLIKQSKILNDHFTGFALYDLDEKKMIYEQNDDKYYTPASNTKLFTWYTCLRMLGDSIPGLRYEVHGDSLIFWGTGDPSFLHSDLKGVNAYNFLKISGKQLFFARGSYQNDFFGDGWAWNDYDDDYLAEINELPVENNVATFKVDSSGNLTVKPAYFTKDIVDLGGFGFGGRHMIQDHNTAHFKLRREFLSNEFLYPATAAPANYSQQIPWKTSDTVTQRLLEDTLKESVTLITRLIAPSAKTIYNANADTVYRHLLQPSDNFIAEQLLLVCSSVKFNVLNTDSVINYSKTHYLNDLPDTPQWVDGSGLSRYNMFTPRSIVALLIKILQVKDEQMVHSELPQGGVAGTIKSAYKTDNGQIFVWAKTGSLRYDYNQSGYIVTRKGKRLAFSFMNNNFTEPARQVRNEMVRIITFIHDNY